MDHPKSSDTSVQTNQHDVDVARTQSRAMICISVLEFLTPVAWGLAGLLVLAGIMGIAYVLSGEETIVKIDAALEVAGFTIAGLFGFMYWRVRVKLKEQSKELENKRVRITELEVRAGFK